MHEPNTTGYGCRAGNYARVMGKPGLLFQRSRKADGRENGLEPEHDADTPESIGAEGSSGGDAGKGFEAHPAILPHHQRAGIFTV